MAQKFKHSLENRELIRNIRRGFNRFMAEVDRSDECNILLAIKAEALVGHLNEIVRRILESRNQRDQWPTPRELIEKARQAMRKERPLKPRKRLTSAERLVRLQRHLMEDVMKDQD